MHIFHILNKCLKNIYHISSPVLLCQDKMVNQDIKQFLPSQIKYSSKEDRQHTYRQELSAISAMQKLKQKKMRINGRWLGNTCY